MIRKLEQFLQFMTIAGSIIAIWLGVILLAINIAKANPIDQAITDKLAWDNTELAADISDYSVYTLMTAPYIKPLREKNFREMGGVALVQLFNFSLADSVKIRAKRLRPNGRDTRSFYSGHTSNAFTSAGLMCLQKSYCTESLILAGLVAYLRVAAKEHFASDVLVGAGIGYFNGRYVPQIIISY